MMLALWAKCLDERETRNPEAGRNPGAPRSPPSLIVIARLGLLGAVEVHPERTR